MRDELGWVGRLAFRGTRVASELGGRVRFGKFTRFVSGLLVFFAHAEGGQTEGEVTTSALTLVVAWMGREKNKSIDFT
jgi:hypothetical protein